MDNVNVRTAIFTSAACVNKQVLHLTLREALMGSIHMLISWWGYFAMRRYRLDGSSLHEIVGIFCAAEDRGLRIDKTS